MERRTSSTDRPSEPTVRLTPPEKAAERGIRPAVPLDANELDKLYRSATPTPVARLEDYRLHDWERQGTHWRVPRSSLTPILRFADVEAFVQESPGPPRAGRLDAFCQIGVAKEDQPHYIRVICRPEHDSSELIEYGLGVIAERRRVGWADRATRSQPDRARSDQRCSHLRVAARSALRRARLRQPSQRLAAHEGDGDTSVRTSVRNGDHQLMAADDGVERRATRTDMTDDAAMQAGYPDDIDVLLIALPPEIAERVRSLPAERDLIEVVMDLGRKPEARFGGGGEEVLLRARGVRGGHPVRHRPHRLVRRRQPRRASSGRCIASAPSATAAARSSASPRASAARCSERSRSSRTWSSRGRAS